VNLPPTELTLSKVLSNISMRLINLSQLSYSKIILKSRSRFLKLYQDKFKSKKELTTDLLTASLILEDGSTLENH